MADWALKVSYLSIQYTVSKQLGFLASGFTVWMQQRTIFRLEFNGHRLASVYGELVLYLMFIFYFVLVVWCCFWTEYCGVSMICTRMLSAPRVYCHQPSAISDSIRVVEMFCFWSHYYLLGSGDISAVRAPDSWSKGRGFEPLQERQENFLLQGPLLCWLLFRYPFHPRVTAVARKRSQSFCQRRRWQVTAKHAYTLRMWLCMKWHGAWLYGVHRTHQDWLSLAADSCGTGRASAVSTPLRWIFKNVL